MIYDEYLVYTNKYRQQYGDKTIVFMEVGGFYEMYGVNNSEECSGTYMDTVSCILNIAVTRKNKTVIENSHANPMFAGFPSYAVKKYIDILVNHDYTIIIVDQVTQAPSPKRKVTNIISPSTYVENLNHTANNLVVIYLEPHSSLFNKNKSCCGIGCSVIDVSTSKTLNIETSVSIDCVNDELIRMCLLYSPRELVVISKVHVNISIPSHVYCHNFNGTMDSSWTKLAYQNEIFNQVFKDPGLLNWVEYLDLERSHMARISFAYMLNFIYEHNETWFNHVSKPTNVYKDKHMLLFNDAIQQLNIVGSQRSLEDILNNSITPMGKRYFKERLLNPWCDTMDIQKSYALTRWNLEQNKYKKIRDVLTSICDMERYIRKQMLSPTQLNSFFISLQSSLVLTKLDENHPTDMVTELNACVRYFLDRIELSKLTTALTYEDIFKAYPLQILGNRKVIELKSKIDDLRTYFTTVEKELEYLVKLEYSEKEGYYFNTTKKRFAELDRKGLLNNTYSCVQQTKSQCRLVSDAFIEYNDAVISLTSEYTSLIKTMYIEFVNEFKQTYEGLIDQCVSYIQSVDFGSTNAYNSVQLNLNEPEIIGDTSSIYASQLRHPIIEQVQTQIGYVPNDIIFDTNTRGRVIYGINASGKSSLMKSVGIALLMAQAGMFVAANAFRYFPYRSIFTRIMIGDNLYKGQSTFTSEMIQLKNILRYATHESLVIGDELCSGTESTSAVSLVSAGLIYLSKRDVSFMFATHLHELTKINHVTQLCNVKMNHLSVRYDPVSQDIIYDRVLKCGPCETLYGLEVCKSLDLDPSFLESANTIRHSILNVPEQLVPKTPSTYNRNVYKTKCKICNRPSDEIHHIRFQCEADENGRIEHYHKNSEFNLVDLCKHCHESVHKKHLVIHSYSQTSSGIKLSFEHFVDPK